MNGPSSNPGDPLAYFITWTTYGTWLPGDDRGWRSKSEAGIHQPNPWLVEWNRSQMKETEFTLTPRQRSVVEETIRKHCDLRGWTLHALNARSNHVHVVVTANAYSPEDARDQFKAWCTRHLKKDLPKRKRFWTEGGDCEVLYEVDEVEAAVMYVQEGQDNKGREEFRRGTTNSNKMSSQRKQVPPNPPNRDEPKQS